MRRLAAPRVLLAGALLVAASALAGCTKLRAGAIAALRPISHIARTETVPATPERIARLEAPSGFRVGPWAWHLGHPRMLAVTGDGQVLVTRPDEGDVLALRDTDADGRADIRRTAVSGLPGVHGVALHEGRVFLATGENIHVAVLRADGGIGPLREIVSGLPAGGRHPHHTLGVGPDERLYVSIGSSCNACVEESPLRATFVRFALDGSGREVFARGLRNVQGFDWHPVTGALWGMDNGSDHRGDHLPPEELNRIEAGRDYGWPWAWGRREVDMLMEAPPDRTKQEIAAGTAPMVLGYTAHAAPIGFAFYGGDAFPPQYRGDAFFACHGSWNRIPPSGYEVVRIRFEDGEPLGFEPFVTGWLEREGDGGRHFGRPAGLAVGPDGSLLVSDDVNGIIYRVAWEGGAQARGPAEGDATPAGARRRAARTSTPPPAPARAAAADPRRAPRTPRP